MRVCFAAAACAWGLWGSLGGSIRASHAAEITDLASSFEKGKPFGFKVGASYGFTYKTASITRESVPQLQTLASRTALYEHFKIPAGGELPRTEVVPDLLYTQQRQTLNVRADLGLFQDLQLGIELPLVLRDVRQYDLDPGAGFNRCNPGSWGCIGSLSSTYLDGVYPLEPGDLRSSQIFRPPYRGGNGTDILDTLNLSLMGAPISQRRDPSKPTWVIGVEAQVRIGTVMEYNATTKRVPTDSPLYKEADNNGSSTSRGWNGVSEGLHRFYFRTAISRRFRYVDPYFGLYYMFPLADRSADGSPWKPDYGAQQKYATPQQKAGATFGFEAIPLENKAKGHRLVLNFKGGLDFTFLGRGYSEAWELLASSNALVCDGQTELPPLFNVPMGERVTQARFNPSCNTPASETMINGPQLAKASPYYRQAFTGLTVIENYLTLTAEFGVTAELFHHLRVRLAFNYLRNQGHIITADDAGIVNYANRNTDNNRTCDPNRVDLNCPLDWNPSYRAVINQPGRRYRVDDTNQYTGSAMLQAYW